MHCIESLERNGFSVSSFFFQNSCFDLAAKRNHDHLLVKVLGNIDSLRVEQAEELKKIASALDAIPLIVGEKSKSFGLEDDVWYERYDIPVVSDKTFSKAIQSSVPLVKCFKGKKVASLDAQKLHDRRLELQLSVGDLAQRVGMRSETLYRYEKGFSPSMEAAQKLEKELHCSLVRQSSLFGEFQPKKSDWSARKIDGKTWQKMQRLGIHVALFDHAPFRAYANPGEGILIDQSENDPKELERKAIALEKSSSIFETHSMLLAKESKKEIVEHTPIIQERELLGMKKPRQLLKLLKEREQS